MSDQTKWPKCYKGQPHEIHPILPDDDRNPIVMVCSKCGMVGRAIVDLPKPLDDLPSDAISRITVRKDSRGGHS